MYTRQLYLDDVIPKMERFYSSLDMNITGTGEAKSHAIAVCNSINNIFDYFIRESPTTVENIWEAKNKADFTKALESYDGARYQIPVPDDLFGFIRDVANVGKHMFVTREDKIVPHVGKIIESLGIIRYSDCSGNYYGYKSFVLAGNDKDAFIPIDIYVGFAIDIVTRMLVEAQIIPHPLPGISLKRSLFMDREETEKQVKPIVFGKVGEEMNVAFKNYVFLPDSPVKIRTRQSGDIFKNDTEILFQIKKSPFEVEQS
ncbi:MAG: hypothetical protein MI976_24595 [Pseudomonadales bacterium]|nr:hypothetical protein [Pseudomonadales bacterium]